jgi:hypothetical protein
MSAYLSTIAGYATDLCTNVTTYPSYWAAGGVAALTVGTGLTYLGKYGSNKSEGSAPDATSLKGYYSEQKFMLDELSRGEGHSSLEDAFRDPQSSVVLWTDANINHILNQAQAISKAREGDTRWQGLAEDTEKALSTEFAVMDSLLRSVGEHGVVEWVESWNRGRTAEAVQEKRGKISKASAMRGSESVRSVQEMLESSVKV